MGPRPSRSFGAYGRCNAIADSCGRQARRDRYALRQADVVGMTYQYNLSCVGIVYSFRMPLHFLLRAVNFGPEAVNNRTMPLSASSVHTVVTISERQAEDFSSAQAIMHQKSLKPAAVWGQPSPRCHCYTLPCVAPAAQSPIHFGATRLPSSLTGRVSQSLWHLLCTRQQSSPEVPDAYGVYTKLRYAASSLQYSRRKLAGSSTYSTYGDRVLLPQVFSCIWNRCPTPVDRINQVLIMMLIQHPQSIIQTSFLLGGINHSLDDDKAAPRALMPWRSRARLSESLPVSQTTLKLCVLSAHVEASEQGESTAHYSVFADGYPTWSSILKWSLTRL